MLELTGFMPGSVGLSSLNIEANPLLATAKKSQKTGLFA